MVSHRMEGVILTKTKLTIIYILSLFTILYHLSILGQNRDNNLQKLEEVLPPTPNVKLDWTPLEKVPVPYEGRIVPIITFAQDTLFSIYGKTKYKNESATSIIFKISLLGPEYAKNLEIINIPGYKVKKELGLQIEKNYFSLEQMKDKIETILQLGANLEQKKQQKAELTNIENQMYRVFYQLTKLQEVITGNFDFVYDHTHQKWYKLYELEALKNNKDYENLYKGILALSVAISRESYEKANYIIEKGVSRELSSKNKLAAHAKNVELEFLYTKYNLSNKSLYLFFVAFIFGILSLLSKRYPPLVVITIFFSAIGFTIEVSDIIMRVIISSRAPVSSFYESIYYLAAGTFLGSFIFYLILKNYNVFLCGIFLNTLLLMIGPYSRLNPHIKVLMPALRSPWLIYHVHTIILSYALFSIAFILAHWIVIRYLIKNLIDNDMIYIIYNIIKAGIVFLTIGIILGSVWGAEAWGRYWGWDPKETWALITLLGYLAIVHLKKAGAIQQFGIAIGSILSFFLVGITYYGASFVFVGLHSYAGDNITNFLPLWLIMFVIIETIFISSSIYIYYNRLSKKIHVANQLPET